MLTSRWFIRSFSMGLAAAALVGFAGCATAVDKSEVEKKANPVADLHKDVKAKQDAFEWYKYEDALVKARKEGKFVMIDFYATWCKWCKKLDSDTYTDPKVIDAIKADFVPVKIDAESSAKVVHEMRQMSMAGLADEYKVGSYPALWFVDKDGGRAKLLNGYLPPEDFLKYLDYIKSGAYKNMEFEEYVKKGGAGK